MRVAEDDRHVNSLEGNVPVRKIIAAMSALLLTASPSFADKVLVEIYAGPDDPTKATLGFVIAATALQAGHDVDLFLVGDGTYLITDGPLANVKGVGIGGLQDYFPALSKGAHIFVCALSAKARGIGGDDIAGKSAEFATPDKLVQLAVDADVVLSY